MIDIHKKYIIGISLLIVLTSTLTPYFVIGSKKQNCLNDVAAYLKEKGYEDTEIRAMESSWAFNGLPSYSVNVIFENEPNISYDYFCGEDEGQINYYPLDGKQVSPDQLKNYEE